jgi:hypothetical protein
VVSSRAHGRPELESIYVSAVLMLLCGIGFLIPRFLSNLISAVLMMGAAVWLFSTDTFRAQNWWIYCLFCIPLLLTLRLGAKDSSSPREVLHGN